MSKRLVPGVDGPVLTPDGRIAGGIDPKEPQDLSTKAYVDLQNAAYSSLWFHGSVVTLTISTRNAFTKVTQFVNTGNEDINGNVVGDPTTDDDLTINLAGVYDLSLQASMTNAGGGPVEFNLGILIILNTALTITDATNVTPIVITSAGHGLKTGDGVVITGVGGNTAANGDFEITRINADSFSLQTLSHADVAGNGAYTSGGAVDKIAPGSLILERIVSNTQMGRGALAGTYSLSVGDLVEGYAVNLDGTEDIKFEQIHIAVSWK